MSTPTSSQLQDRALLVGGALFALLFGFAYVHCDIHVDESWLGQQVYSLINRGAVYSEFFRDQPPLDGPIVLYHTAFIWCGAAITKLIGWGLYQLRVVSLLCGLGLLALLVSRKSAIAPTANRWIPAIPLVFSPLFLHQAIIFRPEIMVTLFGFASYLLLERFLFTDRLFPLIASGICAGLAGCAHALGLAFVVAGGMALILNRRYAHTAIFSLIAAIAFSPYLIGWFTDPQLFLAQAFHNPLIQSDLNFAWFQPLLNIVQEHKRWLRNFESVGMSVLFLLALLQMRRIDFNKRRTFWIFAATLAVTLAALPMPKMSRYLTLLLPFFAIAIADYWALPPRSHDGFRRLTRYAFWGWTALYVAAGLGFLTKQAFFQRYDRAATNRQLAENIPEDSLVMAPFDFIFEEQPRFTIQSFRGAWLKGKPDHVSPFLESYADSLGVDYLIFSPEELEDWQLPAVDPATRLILYEKVVYLPDQERWLVRRVGLRK